MEAEPERSNDGRAREAGRSEPDDGENPQDLEQQNLDEEFTYHDGKARNEPEADRLRAMHQGFVSTSRMAALDRDDGMSMDLGR